MRKTCLLLLVAVLSGLSLLANIIMPRIFANDMVLQRNTAIPVWGRADPGEKIEVRFNRQVKQTKAGKDGRWMLRLDAEAAGGPFQMTVKGSNTIVISNILVGEVWLCSGQSNMEWTVGQSLNANTEIAAATNTRIRHFKVKRDISSLPLNDIKDGAWAVCSPATAAEFSAVGYFFAQRISAELNIPVGIINATWGGTNIETWISREGFEGSNEFKEMIAGMPRLRLDSVDALKSAGTRQRIEALQQVKLGTQETKLFTHTNYDDAAWPQLRQPQQWEQQAPGDLDGVVWLRKTVTLTAAEAQGGAAVLELSTIDDEDSTWVNGVPVGATRQWNAYRKYPLPQGLLREEKNTIAIRVVDNGGGGGMYGNAADVRLTVGGRSLPLAGVWKYQVTAVQSGSSENEFPSLCFNAMIHPLVPFAIQGVLWYQGESNAGRAFQYRTAFPLMIGDWRQKWGGRAFPFYYVQLATYTTGGNSNNGCDWAELREAQTLTLSTPNTGMCVTTDIGNPSDIHPTNKQDVGKRMAALALNNIYGMKQVCNGPAYRAMQVNGAEVTLSFDNLGSGLMTPDKYGNVRGFEVAGEDRVFHYARAFIRGNELVVTCDKVPQPVAVRFGWVGDASDNNLFNREGFPAVPFRTDDWKTVTLKEKYAIAKLQ